MKQFLQTALEAYRSQTLGSCKQFPFSTNNLWFEFVTSIFWLTQLTTEAILYTVKQT